MMLSIKGVLLGLPWRNIHHEGHGSTTLTTGEEHEVCEFDIQNLRVLCPIFVVNNPN